MNKRNRHTNLPPSLARQSRERSTLLRVAAVYYFHFFVLACHSLMDTWTCYLTLRFASECLLSIPRSKHLNGLLTCWKTKHPWHYSSVKRSWLCPTIKGSKSLETLFKRVLCKIFEQCLFIRVFQFVGKSRWPPQPLLSRVFVIFCQPFWRQCGICAESKKSHSVKLYENVKVGGPDI
jgi:hypothetical protein